MKIKLICLLLLPVLVTNMANTSAVEQYFMEGNDELILTINSTFPEDPPEVFIEYRPGADGYKLEILMSNAPESTSDVDYQFILDDLNRERFSINNSIVKDLYPHEDTGILIVNRTLPVGTTHTITAQIEDACGVDCVESSTIIILPINNETAVITIATTVLDEGRIPFLAEPFVVATPILWGLMAIPFLTTYRLLSRRASS